MRTNTSAHSVQGYFSHENISVSVRSYLEESLVQLHNASGKANNQLNNTTEPFGYIGFPLDQIDYPVEALKKLPTWEIAVKTTFYVIIILMSLISNTLVIIVILKTSKLRTTTNFFFVNLAVSDLIVTCSSTWVHLVDNVTEGWVFGAFMCKVNTFIIVLSLTSSVLTLTLISCDRFFGIVFAMKAHLTERRARSFIIMVWLCSVIVSCPMLIYTRKYERQWKNHLEIWCGEDWPIEKTVDEITHEESYSRPGRTFYYTFICVVMYFYPITAMSIAYSIIIWKLWSNERPGEQIEHEVDAQNKLKKKVVVMLVVILMVFMICWLPFIVSVLYFEYGPYRQNEMPDWYPDFRYFAWFMAYSNSAFNPLIYAGFNENFRRGFKEMFKLSTNRSRPKRSQYSLAWCQSSYRTNASATQSTHSMPTTATSASTSSSRHDGISRF